MAILPQTNFAHLEQHDEQLLRLGMLAEKYFADDPNTCLLKLRQLAELLARLVAAKTGQLVAPEETQFDLLRRLQDSGILTREIAQLFGEVRRTGNAASHALEGDHRGALSALTQTSSSSVKAAALPGSTRCSTASSSKCWRASTNPSGNKLPLDCLRQKA